ncbi:hypothetical protein VTN02DRAFT_5382 [Thermoascus thermophilus]
MPPDRVIQDSDDEDDATSIDPLQDQSSVRRSSFAESNAGEQRYDAELGQLPPLQSGSPLSKINFDVFLQSPSQERGAQELSSSQQRREERWIPAEIGSGSVGAMMSEISRAQRQLVEDNFTYDDLQLPPTGENADSAPPRSPLPKSNKRSQTMSELNDRGNDGEEYSGSRIKRSRTSLSCLSGEAPEPTVLLQEASHGAEGVRNDSEYAETTNVPLNDGSTHRVHGDTFATSHDGTAANSSYNFFESSIKDNTEMSTIPIPSPARDTSGKQSNAPRQTPGRSKSMQIPLNSPHDTEPSSSLLSPHVKRTKSELPARDILQQSEKSDCDELSLPAAIEVPVEKKRGRKKKQVAPEVTTGDETDELNADGPASASLQTQPTKRGRGRPRKSEVNTGHSEGSEPTQSNPRNDDAAAGAQTDHTVPAPAESNDVNADKTSNNIVPQETERSELYSSPDPEEMDAGLPKEQYIPRPSHWRAQPVGEDMPSESMENPPKESKKKKLKRGKTTSVILKKSYESDVEDDVIWVNEKPDNVVFKDEVNTSAAVKAEVPETKESGSKNVGAMETKPSMTDAAEQKKNATLTDPAAPSPVEEPAPGPKKRGRKRKKTAEPANADRPAEGDPQQLPNKEETSQSKDTSTVLHDVSTNAIPTATNDNQTTNDQDLTADTANEDGDRYPNSPKKKPDQNTALETPKKQKEVSENDTSPPKDATSTSKGPTKHSPISTTSKVPFRVGLSRKARIAPLLKVVRK